MHDLNFICILCCLRPTDTLQKLDLSIIILGLLFGAACEPFYFDLVKLCNLVFYPACSGLVLNVSHIGSPMSLKEKMFEMFSGMHARIACSQSCFCLSPSSYEVEVIIIFANLPSTYCDLHLPYFFSSLVLCGCSA